MHPPGDRASLETSYSAYFTRFGLPLVAAALALVSAITFTGPFRWLAALSEGRRGGYEDTIVFIGAVAAIGLALALVAFVGSLFARLLGVPPPEEIELARADGRFAAFREVYGPYVLAFAVTTALTAGLVALALEDADRRVYDVIVGGPLPTLAPGARVRLHGHPLRDGTVVREGGYTYVPVAAGDGRATTSRHTVFLALHTSTPRVPAHVRDFEGRVLGPLPNVAGVRFARAGIDATDAWVIAPGADDAAPRVGPYVPVLGMLAMLAVALVFARRRPRLRAALEARYSTIEAAIEGVPDPDYGYVASDALGLTLSEARLRALRPELFAFDDAGWLRRLWLRATFVRRRTMAERRMLALIFRLGDTRAAYVARMRDELAIVAVYTDELDAAIMLRFPYPLAEAFGFREGDRLLAVMGYAPGEPVAEDIRPGDGASDEFANCVPYVAELLVDDRDLPRIEARVRAIDEEEWSRLATLAEAYFVYFGELPGRFRDGVARSDVPFSA